MITIVVNCYNSSKTIERTLLSLLNQSSLQFKCLIVDNKSTDHTLKVIQPFLDRRDLFVLYSLDEHVSLSKARDLALKQVNTEFFSFLDSDDIYLPNRIQTIGKFLKENPRIDLYITNGIENRSFKKCAFYRSPVSLKYILENNRVFLGALIFNSKLIPKLEFDNDFSLIEEYYMLVKLSKSISIVDMYIDNSDVYWDVSFKSLTWKSLANWSEEYSQMKLLLRESLDDSELTQLDDKVLFFDLFKREPPERELYRGNLRSVYLIRKYLGLQVFTFIYKAYRLLR